MEIFYRPYIFWDVDPKDIDPQRHKRFIIARVLCFGLPQDVNYILEYYPEDNIIDTIKHSRLLDRKTATFWAIHFGLPKEEIRCLKLQSNH